MNKTEFVAAYAEKTKETKKRAGELVETFLDLVQTNLGKGNSVAFIGWGTFSVRKAAERMGKNPKTGAALKIPAKKVAKFKVGKTLAEKVKKGK